MNVIVSFCRHEDAAYIAECPSIPGSVGQGATMAEADANIREAIRQCLEVPSELGLPDAVAAP